MGTGDAAVSEARAGPYWNLGCPGRQNLDAGCLKRKIAFIIVNKLPGRRPLWVFLHPLN